MRYTYLTFYTSTIYTQYTVSDIYLQRERGRKAGRVREGARKRERERQEREERERDMREGMQ
jgi:hypothetical protein